MFVFSLISQHWDDIGSCNPSSWRKRTLHYGDVIMTTIASQITSLTVVYSSVYSGADQRKHQSSASLAFVQGIHRDRWIPRTKGQLRGNVDDVIMRIPWRWMLVTWRRKGISGHRTFPRNIPVLASEALWNICSMKWDIHGDFCETKSTAILAKLMHYSDVPWASWRIKSQANPLFVQQFV